MSISAPRSLATLLLLALAACGTAPAGDGPGPVAMNPVADGTPFNLLPQQDVALADQSRLRFVEVANDSRCRPGQQCIWAGDAELVFQWQPASGASETFSLHTTKGDKVHAIGERRLSLLSLSFDEPPAASLRVDRAD
ncbi:hypothetical protein MQC88_08945 [Luteimonas sp. 50]|uniref:Protease inhibitor Inh n=1 Tax=Cognatiluteimonas sedimenti TaxID=2927791 RepID=A0ABT0A521_9GAMM|nr:hypothetical protein [Lysobacter sedimenti]MCJ0826082.1 hypothetical protein [Lysobacter sedimenti]